MLAHTHKRQIFLRTYKKQVFVCTPYGDRCLRTTANGWRLTVQRKYTEEQGKYTERQKKRLTFRGDICACDARLHPRRSASTPRLRSSLPTFRSHCPLESRETASGSKPERENKDKETMRRFLTSSSRRPLQQDKDGVKTKQKSKAKKQNVETSTAN